LPDNQLTALITRSRGLFCYSRGVLPLLSILGQKNGLKAKGKEAQDICLWLRFCSRSI